MKLFLILFAIWSLFLAKNETCSAQNVTNKQISRDSTPIELLDYHLSKDQFIYYYGKDDTSKAIIHMFFRKRGLGVIDFVVLPLGSSVVGGLMEAAGAVSVLTGGAALTTGLGLIAGGAIIAYGGFFGFPIYYLIQRSIYTRQKLIFTLVERERGERIPYEVLVKLRDIDF